MSGAAWQRDFVGYGARPPRIEWPNGARLAISVVVNYEEGAEVNHEDDGDHETLADLPSAVGQGLRDVNMESVLEYGSRVGVWRLLSILRDQGVPSTFLLCGQAIERNPAVATAVVREGHEPSGHGYRWRAYHDLTEAEQMDDILRCVGAIRELSGERPVGWLTRYGPSPLTRELLFQEGGFLYDNMAFNDDAPYYVPVGPERLPWLVIPYTLELNDARYWRGGLLNTRDFEDCLARALDQLLKEGREGARMMTVALHCRISGTPSRAGVLARFLARRPPAGLVRAQGPDRRLVA